MVIPSHDGSIPVPTARLDAILAPDAAQLEAPMARRLTGQELQDRIDLDFSDYLREPREGLGSYAMAYVAGIVLLLACMVEFF